MILPFILLKRPFDCLSAEVFHYPVSPKWCFNPNRFINGLFTVKIGFLPNSCLNRLTNVYKSVWFNRLWLNVIKSMFASVSPCENWIWPGNRSFVQTNWTTTTVRLFSRQRSLEHTHTGFLLYNTQLSLTCAFCSKFDFRKRETNTRSTCGYHAF